MRLPIALTLLWLIWWGVPIKSWQIADDIIYVQSAQELEKYEIGQKLLLEAEIYPSQKDIQYYDDAFIYERKVRYKSQNSAELTNIFAATQPSVRLQFKDGSFVILPQGKYQPKLQKSSQGGVQNNIADHWMGDKKRLAKDAAYRPSLYPSEYNYELRQANVLAERAKNEKIKGKLAAKGFREGDVVMLYATLIQQGKNKSIRPEIMDRGNLKRHQKDMAKAERRTFWLSVFLRSFLSLFPLGILAGLWKK